ncbi:MAG: hypothetical protein IJZ29_01105 [Clostridia bacterium]|nr:hypothetical protein [Clostridia bacterium]
MTMLKILKNNLLTKKTTNKELVYLSNVNFLLFCKSIEKKHEAGFSFKDYIYFEIVPIIYNKDFTRYKDLRTNKIYNITYAKHDNKYYIAQHKKLIQDYGVEVDFNSSNNIPYCTHLVLANVPLLDISDSKLSRDARNTKYNILMDEDVFAKTSVVVELADALKEFYLDKNKKEIQNKIKKSKMKKICDSVSQQSRDF